METGDIKNLRRFLFKDYPVYLFGSEVTGRTCPMNDIDIAVLLKEPYPRGRCLIHKMDYLAFRLEDVFKKEVGNHMKYEDIQTKIDVILDNLEKLCSLETKSYGLHFCDSAPHRLQTSIQALLDIGSYIVANSD